MAVSVCKKLSKESPKNVCLLCNSFAIDEQLYGCMYQSEDVIVHHYCVLLSSQMEQNGEDEEGILGFLVPDILKEKRRAAKSVCDYCHLLGATVLCAHGRCKVKFHVPCGVKNNCLNQFFGAFRSFCAKHRPEQKIPVHIIQEAKKSQPTCTICFENVVAKACANTLWAPCCSRNAWFHRKCIQSLAINAGYFFKCPLCNDKESFQKAMLNFGIYVPQQDASWETVPNAFHELLERHNTCDLPGCKCPKSRKFNAPGTIWELILCSTCASQGIHIGCGKLKFNTTEWECPECCKTIEKAKASKRLGIEENSADSSSDESSSASRKFRMRKKIINKKLKDKKLVKRSKLNTSNLPSSSNSPSSSSSGDVGVPDETADIIVISSDDELIEIVDSPKPVAFITHTATITSDVDSSSDIDIVGDYPVNPLVMMKPRDQPTALIKFHDPAGNGTTVVSASSFRHSSTGMSSPVNSNGPVQIPGPNPDVIITLDNESDRTQHFLHSGNPSTFCDKNFNNQEIQSQPRSSTSVIDCPISTPATAPDQFSNPLQNSHFGPRSFQDSSNSATELCYSQSSSIESANDEQEPRFSSADLPVTNEGNLTRRYNHLGLKPLRIVIKPLKFLQIGKNRFLTIIPSSKKKKKIGRKANKLRLRIEDNSLKMENFSSVSAQTKRKLCNSASDPHPLKKLILDACSAQKEENLHAVPKASNQFSGTQGSKNAHHFNKPLTPLVHKKILKNISSPTKLQQLTKSSVSNAKVLATKKNGSSSSLEPSLNSKITQKKNFPTNISVKAGSSKSHNATDQKSESASSNPIPSEKSKAQESKIINVIENFFRPFKASSPPNLTNTTNDENLKILKLKSVEVEEPKVPTPEKSKVKSKIPVKEISECLPVSEFFSISSIEAETSEKLDSKSIVSKSEREVGKTDKKRACSRTSIVSSRSSLVCSTVTSKSNSLAGSKKPELQRNNDTVCISPNSKKRESLKCANINSNSPRSKKFELQERNNFQFDLSNSEELESRTSNDIKYNSSIWKKLESQKSFTQFGSPKSKELEFQECNYDTQRNAPKKDRVSCLKTDKHCSKKTQETKMKPKSEKSLLFSGLKYHGKGTTDSPNGSQTPPPPVCNKSTRSSSDLKSKLARGKINAQHSERSSIGDTASRSKGKLIPISLFDPPAVLEADRFEGKSSESLKTNTCSKNYEAQQIKSKFTSKLPNVNSLERTERNKMSESKSSSPWKSLDLSGVAAANVKVVKSAEKSEEALNEEVVVVRANSAGNSCRKSKAIHQSCDLKSSKTPLKRDSPNDEYPTMCKKIRQETHLSTDKPHLLKEHEIIPLFDFELELSEKVDKTNKKTRQNRRSSESSVKTTSQSSKSDRPLGNSSEEVKGHSTSQDIFKKPNSSQEDRKSCRDFPKIISLSTEKDPKTKLPHQNAKGGVKGSSDITLKVSPPINKFFPVLERSVTSTAKKFNEPKVNRRPKCLADASSSTNKIKQLATKEESTPKSISKQKNSSFSRTIKEMKRDSKENIGIFKANSHQTRITDYCSKNSIHKASMALQPFKKFV